MLELGGTGCIVLENAVFATFIKCKITLKKNSKMSKGVPKDAIKKIKRQVPD